MFMNEYEIGDRIVCKKDVVIHNKLKFTKNKLYLVTKALYINDDFSLVDEALPKSSLHYFILDNSNDEEYFSGMEAELYFTSLPEIRKEKINHLLNG